MSNSKISKSDISHSNMDHRRRPRKALCLPVHPSVRQSENIKRLHCNAWNNIKEEMPISSSGHQNIVCLRLFNFFDTTLLLLPDKFCFTIEWAGEMKNKKEINGRKHGKRKFDSSISNSRYISSRVRHYQPAISWIKMSFWTVFYMISSNINLLVF